MGLNQPLAVRYLHWAGGMLTLDFGRSYTYSVPVIDLVASASCVSLPLALIALALSTAIAIPVGIFAAARRGRAGDTLAMGAAQLGVAVPNFWFALLLDLCLRRLAAAGAGRRLSRLERGRLAGAESADPAGDRACLAAGGDPGARHALGAARRAGRGLSSAPPAPRACRDRDVLWRHALRNAMIPVLTILGLQFAFLLAGTIIIENVFYLPGLGRLVFQAITQRDLIVVESVVMLLVAAVIVVNLAGRPLLCGRRPAAEEPRDERCASTCPRTICRHSGQGVREPLVPRRLRHHRARRGRGAALALSGRPTTSPS